MAAKGKGFATKGIGSVTKGIGSVTKGITFGTKGITSIAKRLPSAQKELHRPPIQGVIEWGWRGFPVHNRLQVWTVSVNDVELTDASRPANQDRMWQQAPFEYRLFRIREVCLHGKLCALEEWIEPKSKENHHMRIAVFDSTTGQEIVDPRFEKLKSVSELKKLDLSK